MSAATPWTSDCLALAALAAFVCKGLPGSFSFCQMAAQLRKFSDLGCISKPTLQVLDSLGFQTATPVQEATIPLFCGHKDVAVDACTGSGKTLAFVVPVIEKLRRREEKLKQHQVGAIIVSPTRELAKQIHAVAAPFVASCPGLSSLLLVGGTDPAADVAAFKASGGHIMVGTPGRLDDVMKRLGAALDTKQLEVLVLDEADRLLDMGFRQQLDAIMARLPKQRRTGLFSATQTEAVEALARAGLRNPVKVAVAVSATPAAADDDDDSQPPSKKAKHAGQLQAAGGAAAAGGGGGGGNGLLEQVTPSSLRLEYVVCPVEQKLPQLVSFLSAEGRSSKVIVYFLTCASVEFYSLILQRLPALKGLQVSALHGKLKQAARESTLSKFSTLPAGVLLCTDVAARGLDIPDIAWILQYDMPQDPAAFIHRVGRTARMGRSGSALALLTPNEAHYVEFLKLRKVNMQQGQLRTDAPEACEVSSFLRQAAECDREVMEKGSRAFVSLVRGYKEHHCKFVFRLQELPLGPLAQSMGLLKLPKMPELKKGSAANALQEFVASAVDPDSVKFKDKAREKQRQQVLKQRQQQQEQAGSAADKQQRQAKQQQQQQQQQQGARLTAAKRRQLQARDELAELQHDYSMLRKLKKGKISEHAFDVATGLSSDSEMEDPAAAAAAAAAAGDDDSEDDSAGAAAAAGGGSRGGSAAGAVGATRHEAAAAGAGKRQQQKRAAVLLPPQRSVLQQEQQLRKRKQRRLKKRQQGAAG